MPNQDTFINQNTFRAAPNPPSPATHLSRASLVVPEWVLQIVEKTLRAHIEGIQLQHPTTSNPEPLSTHLLHKLVCYLEEGAFESLNIDQTLIRSLRDLSRELVIVGDCSFCESNRRVLMAKATGFQFDSPQSLGFRRFLLFSNSAPSHMSFPGLQNIDDRINQQLTQPKHMSSSSGLYDYRAICTFEDTSADGTVGQQFLLFRAADYEHAVMLDVLKIAASFDVFAKRQHIENLCFMFFQEDKQNWWLDANGENVSWFHKLKPFLIYSMVKGILKGLKALLKRHTEFSSIRAIVFPELWQSALHTVSEEHDLADELLIDIEEIEQLCRQLNIKIIVGKIPDDIEREYTIATTHWTSSPMSADESLQSKQVAYLNCKGDILLGRNIERQVPLSYSHLYDAHGPDDLYSSDDTIMLYGEPVVYMLLTVEEMITFLQPTFMRPVDRLLRRSLTGQLKVDLNTIHQIRYFPLRGNPLVYVFIASKNDINFIEDPVRTALPTGRALFFDLSPMPVKVDHIKDPGESFTLCRALARSLTHIADRLERNQPNFPFSTVSAETVQPEARLLSALESALSSLAPPPGSPARPPIDITGLPPAGFQHYRFFAFARPAQQPFHSFSISQAGSPALPPISAHQQPSDDQVMLNKKPVAYLLLTLEEMINFTTLQRVTLLRLDSNRNVLINCEIIDQTLLNKDKIGQNREVCYIPLRENPLVYAFIALEEYINNIILNLSRNRVQMLYPSLQRLIIDHIRGPQETPEQCRVLVTSIRDIAQRVERNNLKSLMEQAGSPVRPTTDITRNLLAAPTPFHLFGGAAQASHRSSQPPNNDESAATAAPSSPL